MKWAKQLFNKILHTV